MESKRARAVQKWELAQQRLTDAEEATYCCDAARTKALSYAKKQVKRWSDWITDDSILDQQEISFDD